METTLIDKFIYLKINLKTKNMLDEVGVAITVYLNLQIF